MTDVLTPAQRKLNMSRIRAKNTGPEMKVRSALHRLGYRYRLHKADLPGKPDIALVSRKKVIFVNGCFFHMHSCPLGQVVPKTNTEFWEKKRLATVERDRRNCKDLVQLGWTVIQIWECQTRKSSSLNELLGKVLTK
jgi:DNA mismatch endonuclease, patch repair protein